LKIELPNQEFKYITENSKECDKQTAFVLTSQNEKYLQNAKDNNAHSVIKIADIAEAFGVDKIKIVGITGTNGKTTVVKMIVSLLESAGYKVFTNKTGSNFTRGILSALVDNSSLTGRLDADIAVLEVDEAYSRIIAKQVNPVATTVTNVMRDQLDRYGEIDKTADLIGDCLSLSKAAILNADDQPVAELADRLKEGATLTYYGVASKLRKSLPTDAELLGDNDESATKNGIKKDVLLSSVDPPQITIELGGESFTTKIELEGVHNALNATSAVATVWHVLGDEINIKDIIIRSYFRIY